MDKKRKKNNWIAVWLAIAVIVLAVSGSYAVYTSNFQSVKRVVSTGRRSDTLFGSNYLSLVNTDDTVYTSRHVSPTAVRDDQGNTIYIFTVQICNYVYGNAEVHNTNNINYTLNVTLSAMDGGSLPDDVSGICIRVNNDSNMTSFQSNELTFKNQTLAGNESNMNTYTFNIPDNLKDKVKFEIIAVPSDDSSKDAVNNQKLAGIIILLSLTPTEGWTGKFIDFKVFDPEQYDAFNYEIFGNGSGTVTLTWDNRLQISKWFTAKDISIVNNTCSFTAEGTTTAYQLQFYRNPDVKIVFDEGSSLAQKWTTMEAMVTVDFGSGSVSTSS